MEKSERKIRARSFSDGDYPGTSPSSSSFDLIRFEKQHEISTGSDQIDTEDMIYSSVLGDYSKTEEYGSCSNEPSFKSALSMSPPVEKRYATFTIGGSSSEDEDYSESYSQSTRRRMHGRSRSENSYPHTSNRTCPEMYRGSLDSMDSTKITSTDEMFSDSLLLDDELLDEVSESSSIEHDIVATKFGLPYEIVECSCFKKVAEKSEECDGECAAKSCWDFEKFYGKIDERQLSQMQNSKKVKRFKKASIIFDEYIKGFDKLLEKEFLEAEYNMKVFYHNCWIKLMESFEFFRSTEELHMDTMSRKAVVKSCERILSEQALFFCHYKIKRENPGMKIVLTGSLRHDFIKAGYFLQKEYPSLFVHLMFAHNFLKILDKRIKIEANRYSFVSLSKETHEKLTELEEQASNDRES